jgi:hypothetical protein
VAQWPGLIWDACTLINLAATGRAEEVLRSMGCPCFVVQKVREDEVIFLRPMPGENPLVKCHLLGLSPLLVNDALFDFTLTDEEQEMFVDLAVSLDDGEAMTLAAAYHRRLCMVTDERKVISLAAALSIPITILTTPAWLKHWAEARNVSSEVLDNVQNQVETRARYHPHMTDPLCHWWFHRSDGR